MLTETLEVITQVAMLVFVVGSMAAMGLGLTVARITQPLGHLGLRGHGGHPGGRARGWLAGLGRQPRERTLLGLATANRNIAAALVIAASIGGDVVVYTLVGALTIPVALIVLAGQIGYRAAASDEPLAG